MRAIIPFDSSQRVPGNMSAVVQGGVTPPLRRRRRGPTCRSSAGDQRFSAEQIWWEHLAAPPSFLEEFVPLLDQPAVGASPGCGGGFPAPNQSHP